MGNSGRNKLKKDFSPAERVFEKKMLKLGNGTNRTRCVNRRRTNNRMNPAKNLVQNSLLEVKGWLKRKDLVFPINSPVKEIVPRNKEKMMGMIK